MQFLFAANFVVAKLLLQDISVTTLVAIRFFSVAVLLILVFPFFWNKRPPLSVKFIGSAGILAALGYYLAQFLMLKGLEYSNPSNVALIMSFVPIMTLLIVVLKKETPLTMNKILGFTISFVAILSMLDLSKMDFAADSLRGDLLAFGAATCLALFFTFSKNYLKSSHPIWTNGYLFIFAAVFSFPLFFVGEDLNTINFTSELVAGLLYIILGATALAYILTTYLLKRLKPELVSIYAYLQPILASLLASIFLDVELNPNVFLATLFLFIGFVLANRDAKSIDDSGGDV